MQPPVEFRDRSDYKRKMNELLKIDPSKTVVVTVDMQNDYLDIEVATAPVAPEEAKRVTDAYHGTDLEMLLSKVFKAQTVVLTGINTDTCVYATMFGTSNRGFQPVVISDCVASMRGLDHHWMALELMSRSVAWVMTVDEFKAKIQTAKVLQPAAAH